MAISCDSSNIFALGVSLLAGQKLAHCAMLRRADVSIFPNSDLKVSVGRQGERRRAGGTLPFFRACEIVPQKKDKASIAVKRHRRGKKTSPR
jgi:hypothetical protein